MQWAQKQKGFTIVELLIVIVVIAILAAITIVAYTGIQDRARTTALQSNLASATRSLESSRLQSSNQQYPTSLPAGLNLSNAVYQSDSASNSYCLTQTVSGVSYFVTSKVQTPTPGVCSGMIGWWPMNGSTDDMLRSVASTNVNGVTAAGQNGKSDTGWRSTGDSTTRYIQTNLLFSSNNFTASIWIRPEADAPNSFSSIMSNARDCCAPYTGFQLDYNRTSMNLVGRLWNGGSGPSSSILGSGIITLNEWQHVALSFDGSTLRLYRNGQEVATGLYTPPSTIPVATIPMKIGGMGSTTSGYSFGGTMDDARVYERALTSSEIEQMYRLGAQ